MVECNCIWQAAETHNVRTHQKLLHFSNVSDFSDQTKLCVFVCVDCCIQCWWWLVKGLFFRWCVRVLWSCVVMAWLRRVDCSPIRECQNEKTKFEYRKILKIKCKKKEEKNKQITIKYPKPISNNQLNNIVRIWKSKKGTQIVREK